MNQIYFSHLVIDHCPRFLVGNQAHAVHLTMRTLRHSSVLAA
jgi:hypothetical protein